MATSQRKQAILAGLQSELGGNAYTHETAEITVTGTMANGSFLKADNTEAAQADVALVAGILDAPDIELYESGDVFVARVAKRNVIANSDVVQYSDAAFGAEALAILDAKGVIFQSAEADFEYK
jgi:hypothetical protein